MSQQPLPRPSGTSDDTMAPVQIALSSVPWRLRRGIAVRGLPPVAVIFGAMLALSALRLLIYWLIARGFGGASHVLCNYDCAWYEQTARAGYDLAPHSDIYANTANWAFFPLYPLLLAAASAIAPAATGMTWAGILLSSICFAGFGTLGAFYLHRSDPSGGSLRMPVPLVWLGLVSLWPGDIYFAFPYSEALYALLMTASLLALSQGRVLGAAAASAALTATRPPGLLMVPVIVADRLRYLWQHHRAGSLRETPLTVLSHVLLPVALAPLGLFGFMAYLHSHIGDGLAFIHVQATWNRHALPPWTFLWDGLAANDWGRVFAHPARESLSVEAAFGAAALILALRELRQRRYREGWLIGASVLLAVSSGLQSMPRFVLTNPVVILALYRMATTRPNRRRLILIALVLGIAQLLILLAWFTGAPVLA